MKLSVVIPFYNECDNVDRMHAALVDALESLDGAYELIFVNDGSRDGTEERMDSLARSDARVKVIHLRRNYGQTAALSAGFKHCSGEVVATLDGDLQNDPRDIPAMVEKLDEGYDMVNGWRKKRQDGMMLRKIPSWLANRLIGWVTGVRVRDLGCALKVMRREIASELRLYGEMHRYLTIVAAWHGAKRCEVETRHHARQFGASKYGLSRTIGVMLDLITIKFLIGYSARPMRLFGLIGLFCAGGSAVAGASTVLMRLLQSFDMTGNPLLYFSLVLFLASLQFFSLGLLGEMAMRTYYETQEKPIFAIRRTVNLDGNLNGRDENAVLRRAA